MTLGKLIKELQKLEAEHGPRVKVAANVRELSEICQDTFDYYDLDTAKFELVLQADGNGFGITNRDGSERYARTIVLSC